MAYRIHTHGELKVPKLGLEGAYFARLDGELCIGLVRGLWLLQTGAETAIRIRFHNLRLQISPADGEGARFQAQEPDMFDWQVPAHTLALLEYTLLSWWLLAEHRIFILDLEAQTDAGAGVDLSFGCGFTTPPLLPESSHPQVLMLPLHAALRAGPGLPPSLHPAPEDWQKLSACLHLFRTGNYRYICCEHGTDRLYITREGTGRKQLQAWGLGMEDSVMWITDAEIRSVLDAVYVAYTPPQTLLLHPVTA